MKRHFKFDNHFGSEYSVMFLLRYYFDNLILISYVILLVRISTWSSFELNDVITDRNHSGPIKQSSTHAGTKLVQPPI